MSVVISVSMSELLLLESTCQLLVDRDRLVVSRASRIFRMTLWQHDVQNYKFTA